MNGEHVFELTADSELAVITAIRIQQITQYKSTTAPDSTLTVAKFQTLLPSEEKRKRRRWTIPKDGGRKSPNPEAWIQAHVSSSTLDVLLKENIDLPLGERLSWDESLQEDICDGLFGPALEAIAQLEEVGKWNNNGLSGGKLNFTNSVAEAREGSGVVFW